MFSKTLFSSLCITLWFIENSKTLWLKLQKEKKTKRYCIKPTQKNSETRDEERVLLPNDGNKDPRAPRGSFTYDIRISIPKHDKSTDRLREWDSDKGGGGQTIEKFAEVICEWHLSHSNKSYISLGDDIMNDELGDHP